MIIGVVGLVIAFVLLLIFSNRRTRRCRWREDHSKDKKGARYFCCVACGAETFTTDARLPGVCFADEIKVPE